MLECDRPLHLFRVLCSYACYLCTVFAGVLTWMTAGTLRVQAYRLHVREPELHAQDRRDRPVYAAVQEGSLLLLRVLSLQINGCIVSPLAASLTKRWHSCSRVAQEFQAKSPLQIGQAIGCLANIVTPELAQDLLSDVVVMLTRYARRACQ
jgi:hypothetical protein